MSIKVNILLLGVISIVSIGLSSAQTDTTHTLNNFTVYGTHVEFNTPGRQKIDIQDCFKQAMQVSEVAKFFSGVNMKDYGGIGGLKTISVRGLGPHHTAVSIDGVSLNDCQTGQVDVGKLSMENIDNIALLNANSEADIFKPARLYASANTLQVYTHIPQFKANKPVNVCAGLKVASALTFQPHLLLEVRMAPHWSSSLSAEYLYSKGNYKYVMHYGGPNDSTSIERRTNGDVSALSAVWNVFYTDTRNELHLKAYAYYARNGLPGAAILYNPEASQRIHNDTYFIQGRYQHRFNAHFSYQCVLKANYAHTEYIDTTFWNSTGGLDNHYYQRELYVANVLLYKHNEHWQCSLSNDVIYNNMSSNMDNFPQPHRVNVLTNAATVYTRPWWRLQANVLHTYVLDITQADQLRTHYNKCSPGLNVEIRLLPKEKLTLTLGCQYVFRMPTFNDLYYTNVGNRSLKPETIHQALGTLAWVKNVNNTVSYIRIAASGYFHRVNNKIVAIPTRNLFLWSMLNYGKVNIAGADLNADIQIHACSWLRIDMAMGYAYQHAVDVTNVNSKTYQNQIPYTPHHSGSARVVFHTSWFALHYTLQAVGARYTLGQNIPQNRLDPYWDHAMGISTDVPVKNVLFTLGAEVLNMANKNYEVVANFPVQGISWRINAEIKW